MQIRSTLQQPRPSALSPAPAASENKETSQAKPGVSLEEIFDPDFITDNATGIGVGMASNALAAGYPSTWAHEIGHAKMINLLYDGANPQVEVFPFKGGVTKWRLSPLSDVGQKFGPNYSRALVSGAGTLVDMGIATTAFGAGFKIRKKHPVMGAALMTYAGMTMLNSVLYAGSALTGDMSALAKEGNDFANLAVRVGLHPLASIAILGALLPLEYMALNHLEKKGLI